MNARMRASTRQRGNGIKATMATGARKVLHAMDEAGDAAHRGSAAIGRAERRLASRVAGAGRNLKRRAGRHRVATASAMIAGAGLLYLVARMARRM